MATDLQTRKTSSKSEAYLQRKFAELCARIERVDLIAHLLALSLTILGYAFFIGLFDWFAGNSTANLVRAARWISFSAFLGLFGFLLVQTARCRFRRVNPYYVAHQIEKTLPDAKNILISWLDLRDEEVQSAFQRNLSTRAAEQLQESDAEQTVKKRKNWIMLGALGLPTVGLLSLLILGPSAFASSLLRAFIPFYTPQPVAQTQITLVQPDGGDAEVSPTQSITFAAKIEGRIPAANRPDAPKLSYRYQANEDYLPQPLQPDGAGTWTAQLHPAQLRTGFSYKISAGDAETPEHHVRVRARAHVKKFEITYYHQAYQKLPRTTTSVFPNQRETRPVIRGPRGSEVELSVRASRPVQKMSVEIVTAKATKEVQLRKLSEDAFACRWKLDQPGQFRVAFTSTDGEENTDRDWYYLEVPADDIPRVALTQPGKDVQLPENGTLELLGEATSNVGLKSLTLHFRVPAGSEMLAPRVYRPRISFKFDDGAYPGEVPYMDVVAMDQLKNDMGVIIQPAPGSVIEYWLEAVDCTDFPNPAGNIGKSPVYKVTLLPATKDIKQQAIQNKAAQARQENFEKQQDDKRSKENKERAQNPNGGAGDQDPQKQLDALKNEKKDAGQKISDAIKQEDDMKDRGGAKGPEQNQSAAKAGPPNSPDDPQAQPKDSPSTPPDDTGNAKDRGDGQAGASKDAGPQKEKKESASKGERKDGPQETPSTAKDDGGLGKQESAGGTKDGGPMGMNAPMPQPAKDPGPDDGAPMPLAKGANSEPQTQGNAKGIEQNGPDVPTKDIPAGVNSTQPPEAASKASTMNDAAGTSKGEPNQGTPDQAKQAGNSRADDAKAKQKEPDWDELGKLLEQLSNHDAKADEAGKEVADIANNSNDPRKREIAKEMLDKNGRDPATGKEKKKGPNRFGSGGTSAGIGDAVKAAAANREFASRIGQMQLDDWKKRVTPDLLKKAGLSEAEWQRYVKNMQSYDALVRQLNAKLVKDALKKGLRGGTNPNAGIREVEGTGPSSDRLDAGRAPPPPELRDAMRRFLDRRTNP
jgi:collagen type III alpha